MRCLQKLVRNGNSTQVTIPRSVLIWLDWLPGEQIILEVLEDKSIHIRRPCVEDFTVKRVSSVVLENQLPLRP